MRAREKAARAEPENAELRAELADALRARDLLGSIALAVEGLVGIGLLATGAGLLHQPSRALGLLLAAFLVVGGNYIGRVRPNWFVGIRTPWTLSDDDIWRRTHRLGGRLMVGCGALLVPASLALPIAQVLFALLALVTAALLPPAIYSYLLWRRRTA
jgi:uncharacterized membrane protein